MIPKKRRFEPTAYIISYVCMLEETSKRSYDFMVVYAESIEEARKKFYRLILQTHWMVQILCVKLMKNVITSKQYHAAQKAK